MVKFSGNILIFFGFIIKVIIVLIGRLKEGINKCKYLFINNIFCFFWCVIICLVKKLFFLINLVIKWVFGCL